MKNVNRKCIKLSATYIFKEKTGMEGGKSEREKERERERERERLSHSMGMKVPMREFFFFIFCALKVENI